MSYYDEIELAAANAYGIDPNLLWAVGQQETGHIKDPAKRASVVSNAGAIGHYQITPATAKTYGITGDLRDRRVNAFGSAKILADLLNRFDGNIELATAAYNAGPNRKALNEGRVPNIPETQKYVYGGGGHVGVLGYLSQAKTPVADVAISDVPMQGGGIYQQRGAPEVTTQPPNQYDEIEEARKALQQRRLELQSGTSPDIKAKAAIARRRHELLREQAQQSAKAQQQLADLGRGHIGHPLGQGATFGFADELAGIMGATFGMLPESMGGLPEGTSWMDAYKGIRDQARTDTKSFEARNPGTAFASELAGGLTSGGLGMAKTLGHGMVKHAPKFYGSMANRFIGPRAGKVAESTAKWLYPTGAGAGVGAVAGAGYSEGETPQEVMSDSGTGALIGGAIPGIGGPIARGVTNKTRDSRTLNKIAELSPSMQEIKQKASDLYTRARDAGMRIKGSSYSRILSDMRGDLKEFRYRPEKHTNVATALKYADKKLGRKELDLFDIEEVRQDLMEAAVESGSKAERTLARQLVQRIDDNMADLGPGEVITGSGGGKMLKEARDLWRRSSKLETIQTAIAKADLQATGFENGLRIQFRQILNNEKKARNFTKEEKDMMKKVVNGDFSGNVMRWLGRFGFGEGGSTNWLGSTLSFAGGTAASGNPLVGATIPTMGQLAKAGARRSTQSKANQLMATMAQGQSPQSSMVRLSQLANSKDGVRKTMQMFNIDQKEAEKLLRRIRASQSNPAINSLMGGAAVPAVGLFGE